MKNITAMIMEGRMIFFTTPISLIIGKIKNRMRQK
jgi:hypothetical protein